MGTSSAPIRMKRSRSIPAIYNCCSRGGIQPPAATTVDSHIGRACSPWCVEVPSSLLPAMHLTGTCFHDAVKFFDNLVLSTGPLGRNLRALPSNAWKVVHATSTAGRVHAWVDVHTDLDHLCIQAVVL